MSDDDDDNDNDDDDDDVSSLVERTRPDSMKSDMPGCYTPSKWPHPLR